MKDERKNEKIIFKWDREKIESPLEHVTEKIDRQKVKVTAYSLNSTKIRKIAKNTLKRLQCGTFFFTVHVSIVDFFIFILLNGTLSYNGIVPISLQHHKQCLVWWPSKCMCF